MREITGRHVLIGLIGFFGVMLAVNGVFLYAATSTFSGVSTEDAYRKGLAYNQTLAAYRTQTATGWQASASVGADSVVRLAITKADGLPVDGLAFTGRVSRPAMAAQDRAVIFRGKGRGLYVGDTGRLDPGQWDLIAEARPNDAANAAPYKVTARLWVPQP